MSAQDASGGQEGQALRSDLRIADPDAFYEALLAAHEGLSDEQSNDLDARLVLLLANQVGDLQVLLACIAEARAAGEQQVPSRRDE